MSTTSICFPTPDKYNKPPPSPAKAPAITIDKIIFLFSFIPAYLLASLFNPQALSSNPKVVFDRII